MKTTQSSFGMRVSPANIIPTDDQIFAVLEDQIQDIRNRRDLSADQADEIINQLLEETADKYCGSNRLSHKRFYADFADWRRRQQNTKDLNFVKNYAIGFVLGRLAYLGIKSIFSKK